MPKKKVNPRRIPIKKISKDQLIDDVMKDNMFHAWLIIATSLVEHGVEDIGVLADTVNSYLSSGTHWRDADRKRAEKIFDIPKQKINTIDVRSDFELTKLRRKVEQIALYTGMQVICLGLLDTGRFSEEGLRNIFFSANLTYAEIESGRNDYDTLEKDLLNQMVRVEMAKSETPAI